MVIDIIVGVVLLISALIAFIRGFVREVLTIAGVVCGLVGAYATGPFLSPIFRGWFGVEEGKEVEKLFNILPYTYVADGLAYISVFLVIVILVSIASHFLSEGLRNIGLGAVDRTFGVIFGLARGILLLGLFYLPLSLYMDQETKDKTFEGSRTGFYLEHTAQFLAQFVPESTVKTVEEGAKQVEDAVTTKDKLQELNILKVDKLNPEQPAQPGAAPAQPGTAPAQPAAGQPGYNEPFRDEMNTLFDQQQQQENVKEFNQ